MEGALKSLELVETYLLIGWTNDAVTEIEAFEDRYGIDFQSLVADTQSAHLADPR